MNCREIDAEETGRLIRPVASSRPDPSYGRDRPYLRTALRERGDGRTIPITKSPTPTAATSRARSVITAGTGSVADRRRTYVMSIRDSVAAPPPTRSFRIRRRFVASVGAGLTVCRKRGPALQQRTCGQRRTVLPTGSQRRLGSYSVRAASVRYSCGRFAYLGRRFISWA